jgi:hypothetical protein
LKFTWEIGLIMPAINPILPVPILLLAFGLAFLFIFKSYRKIEKGSEARASLLGLRFLSMTVLFIIAIRPRMEYTEEKIQKDRLYFLADASQSMTIKDMGGKNRRKFTRSMMSSNDREIEELKKIYDVKEFTFARDLIKNPELKGSNKSTSLGTALFQTAVDSKIRKVKGVVLFSDGLNNAGTSINRAVSELKRRKIPIYTLTIGQSSYQGSIVDGVIQELNCPQSIKKDREIQVSIRGIIRGLKDKAVKLKILINNKKVKEISIDSKQEEHNFFNVLNIPTKGLDTTYHKITAQLVTGSKEISPVNNIMNNYFQIKEGGLKLLLLATAPSADFKFLSRLLKSFDDISPTIPNPFLCRTSAGQTFLKDLDVKAFDVIIMQNPDINLIPKELLQKCDAFLKARKQGLLITGETFLSALLKQNLLKEYLPFFVAAHEYKDAEIKPLLSDKGKTHFITGFIEQLYNNEKSEATPPINARISNLKASLTANVLISDGKNPLLVLDKFRRCRVAWVNTNGLWQWSTTPSSRNTYKILWRRMIYHLADREEDLSASLAIFSGKTRFMSGDRISITADLLNEKGVPITTSRVILNSKLISEAKVNRKTTFINDKDEYRTDLSFQQEGLYSLTAEADHDGNKLQSNEIKIYIQEPRVEFERILANAELMDKIASVTGGKSVNTENFGSLLKELKAGGQARSIKTVKSTKDAWDNLFTYLVIALLLSIEWFRRRRIGLS